MRPPYFDMATDFYKELGLGRTASDDEIKRAYRRLARETHPDRNPGDEVAEARFKRISEAYSVLSDPDKRTLFDKYGELGLREGFDPAAYERATRGFGGERGARGGPFGGGVDFEDLFSGAGFSGFGPTGRGPALDVEGTVQATLEQAAAGFSTTVSFTRPRVCAACSGRGVSAQRPCAVCRGAGTTAEPVSLSVNIPQGADTGDVVRLRGRGGVGPNGRKGDVVLRVEVHAHARFRREGLNLLGSVRIDPVDALLGTTAHVTGLDGASLNVTVPPMVSSGNKLRLAGKGLQRKGKTGDLLVTIEIDASGLKLTPAAREAALKLREALSAAAD